MHKALMLFFIVFIYACLGDGMPSQKEVEQEVQTLTTLELKRNYLEDILYEIQSMQFEEESMLFREDVSEKQTSRFLKRKERLNQINAYKIKSYFDNFGYPSRAELGQYAAFAPLAVVLHNDDLSTLDEEQFRYYYGAYKFNDIPEEFFLSYLKAYYQKVTGKSFPDDPSLSIAASITNIMDSLRIDY